MGLFIFGTLIFLAAIVWAFAGRTMAANEQVAFGSKTVWGTAVAGALFGLALIVASTAIYIDDHQGGVVVVKFGSDLPPGRILATNGEKGPQAKVLPPGYQFGYWPWQYQLEAHDNVIVPPKHLATVSTMDGHPLPDGDVFADKWDDANKMMDAQTFLTSENGFKGPQLTVLPPGQYRYNPRLYQIEVHPMLEVAVGEVAVIKANAGREYNGADVELVNGTPLVPKGHRGIWREPYTPNAYYLHPSAHQVIRVKTTERVYNYTKSTTNPGDTKQDTSITVRTSDGFVFPVDVRVNIKISGENAPYVVAMLADPDGKVGDTQFTTIEHRVVLPAIRSIFRNMAESKEALEFLTQRSHIQAQATEQFRQELERWRITTDGVFIAHIGLDDTEQGKKLLQTLTDRRVAVEQQTTLQEERKREEERANVERARENANQERNIAQARAQVVIAEQEAQAKIKRAEADAKEYELKIEAIGGSENWVKLEIARSIMSNWHGQLPQIVILGSGNGGTSQSTIDAFFARMLQQQMSPHTEEEVENDD